MKVKNTEFFAEIGLILITLIWGFSFVVLKTITSAIPTNYIIAIRFGMAALVMLILFFPRIKKLDLQSIKAGTILAVILYASYYFQTFGLKYTTVGNNAFLTSVYVVLVPFLYWVVKREKPDSYNIISALICMTGIGLLTLSSHLSVNLGDIFTLISGLAFGFHIVFTGILSRKNDPILLTFTQFTVTALISFAVALCTETLPTKFETVTVLSLLYVGIFSSMIAMLIQTICQKYVSPSRASLIMSMESLFGTVFGIILLHERPTPKTFIGFFLIFAAVIISETKLNFIKFHKSSEKEPVPKECIPLNTQKEEL